MPEFTVEELWRLFKATDDRIARLSEAADRRNAEADRRSAEADRRIAELKEAMARSKADVDAALKDLSRKMGDFSNRLGEFAEDMVVPAARKLFLAWGIPVHRVHRRTAASFDGQTTEFDILVVNAEHILAVEVKTKPTVVDVDEHIERLRDFKRYFPELHDRKVYGAIAGLCWDGGVSRYAYKEGLFALGQSGDTVVILNDDKFRPKIW